MVLLVIGLLSGALILGKDLIKLAQLRSQISQIEKLNITVNTFKGKYDCLPGDCPDAVELGFGTAFGAGDDGDGNGIIDRGDLFGAPFVTSFSGMEPRNFWQHLGRTNLIERVYPLGDVAGKNSPALMFPTPGNQNDNSDGNFNTTGGMWIVSTSANDTLNTASSHAWMLTTATRPRINGTYLPMEAYMLDSKIDDGFPTSGVAQTVWRADGGTNTVNQCGWNGTNGQSCHDISHGDFRTSDGIARACINDGTAAAPLSQPVYNIEMATANYFICTPYIAAQF